MLTLTLVYASPRSKSGSFVGELITTTETPDSLIDDNRRPIHLDPPETAPRRRAETGRLHLDPS